VGLKKPTKRQNQKTKKGDGEGGKKKKAKKSVIWRSLGRSQGPSIFRAEKERIDVKNVGSKGKAKSNEKERVIQSIETCVRHQKKKVGIRQRTNTQRVRDGGGENRVTTIP